MRYAIIKDKIVENVIEWNGQEMLIGLEGADFVRSETANIGDVYENGAFVFVNNNAEVEGGDITNGD